MSAGGPTTTKQAAQTHTGRTGRLAASHNINRPTCPQKCPTVFCPSNGVLGRRGRRVGRVGEPRGGSAGGVGWGHSHAWGVGSGGVAGGGRAETRPWWCGHLQRACRTVGMRENRARRGKPNVGRRRCSVATAHMPFCATTKRVTQLVVCARRRGVERPPVVGGVRWGAGRRRWGSGSARWCGAGALEGRVVSTGVAM